MKGMSETVSTASNAADAWTNPLRDPRDLRLPRIAGPCSIVIFGVTGDLSRKKLLPAIYDLANRGLLPPSFGLTGFARRDWTEDHFKDFVKENVQAHCRTPFKESTWKQLAAGIRFVQGTFDDPKAFERLSDTVAELDRDRGTRGNHAFYMSVPPRAFPQVSRQLADCGLAKSDKGAWRRVIIEKPFGHDLASAKELDRVVSEVFDPSSVFRIDHYLGKETVQNMLALRFATAGLLLLPLFLRPGLASCGGVGWGRGLLLTLSSGFPMTFLMLMGLTLAPAAHGATIGPGTVTIIAGPIGGSQGAWMEGSVTLPLTGQPAALAAVVGP